MATTNTINLNTTNNSTNNKTTKTSSANKGANNSYSSYAAKANSSKKTYTYSEIFEAAAKKYNISQELLEAVALTESSFNANATSYCGAQGLMQLMPATAKSLGVNNAYDPVENIMGGAKYLSQMLKKYNGDTSLALAAYNGGPGNVAKYGGVPSFCEDYVNKVQNYIKKGVNVPNKTTTVNTNSTAGQIMSKYIDDDTTSSTSKNNTTSSERTNSNSTKNTNNVSQLTQPSSTNNLSSENISNYEDLFNYAAKQYNVSSEILKAIAYTQSSFKSDAVSKSGAVGLMQLMPSTAKELGVSNSYNPIDNVLGGAKYLSQLLKRYNGNTTYAIAAYSAGMGNVDSYNGVPPFAMNFVNKVMTLSKKGVNVPNVTLTADLSSENNNSNSKNHNNKEETAKNTLIDLQV